MKTITVEIDDVLVMSAVRVVGQITHFGPIYLPWHRLVKSNGRIASGYISKGPSQQMKLLEAEGISFEGNKINMKKFQL